MAFNFYGTFSTGQYLPFTEFSKLQEQDIKKRISFLKALLLQVGTFNTEYNSQNYPTKFSVVPDHSYGAKLLKAYKIMGGTPEKDMLLRTRDLPVYLNPGTPITSNINDISGGTSKEYSNGRLDRGNTKYDRSLGIKISKIKNWQLEVIKKKREHLEYKLKRAMDQSDQITQERDMLQKMIDDSARNLDFMFAEAISQMTTNGSMNITSNDDDTHGRLVGDIIDFSNEQDYSQNIGTGGRIEGGTTSPIPQPKIV